VGKHKSPLENLALVFRKSKKNQHNHMFSILAIIMFDPLYK